MWKFIDDVVHDFRSSFQPDVGRGFLHVSNVFCFCWVSIFVWLWLIFYGCLEAQQKGVVVIVVGAFDPKGALFVDYIFGDLGMVLFLWFTLFHVPVFYSLETGVRLVVLSISSRSSLFLLWACFLVPLSIFNLALKSPVNMMGLLLLSF